MILVVALPLLRLGKRLRLGKGCPICKVWISAGVLLVFNKIENWLGKLITSSNVSKSESIGLRDVLTS